MQTEITDPLEVDRLAGICQQRNEHSSTNAFRQVFEQFSTQKSATGFLGAEASAPARNPEVHDIGQPLFLDRLPRHLGKKLLHLSSQDHYVEAVTDLGSELILMRFSDALRELDSAKGMQIHRAHWIAFNAIKRPIKQDGKLLIEMADGKRFPVSRTYLKAVKQALNLK